MKVDADDQEEIRKEELEKIRASANQAQTPTWKKSAGEIASDIADNFYCVASLSGAELRREIIKAIEAEREVTKHYINQMGRWWAKFNDQ